MRCATGNAPPACAGDRIRKRGLKECRRRLRQCKVEWHGLESDHFKLHGDRRQICSPCYNVVYTLAIKRLRPAAAAAAAAPATAAAAAAAAAIASTTATATATATAHAASVAAAGSPASTSTISAATAASSAGRGGAMGTPLPVLSSGRSRTSQKAGPRTSRIAGGGDGHSSLARELLRRMSPSAPAVLPPLAAGALPPDLTGVIEFHVPWVLEQWKRELCPNTECDSRHHLETGPTRRIVHRLEHYLWEKGVLYVYAQCLCCERTTYFRSCQTSR